MTRGQAVAAVVAVAFARALAVVAALLVLSLAGCDKRPCLKTECAYGLLYMQQIGQVLIPVYGDVCHCVVWGPINEDAAR